MPITNYDLMFEKQYRAGEIINLDAAQIWYYKNGETGTPGILEFGLGAVWNGISGQEQVVIHPSAVDQIFYGVVKMTDTFELRDGYTRDAATRRAGYPKEREVSIMRSGQAAVYVDSAVDPSLPVYCRFNATPGTTGVAGCFRSDDGTNTAFQLTYAKWLNRVAAPAAGQMAIAHLDLRLPN